MHDLLTGTLVELSHALHERRVSAREVMQAVLDRIEETNPTLNAVVSLLDRDECFAAAAAADERIGRGEARVLEGIPLGVKDLESVEGMVTSQGSHLYADDVAERDDVHVERLRAAGAIPIAKTNTPEFGPTAVTKNLLHGVTRSPWNLERTPGGSSGGSSAALAGCVLPLVTASDGGGSIRIPAAWTGAFGLKPSHGRVPIGPIAEWNTSHTGVTGPLTKTVEDAALYLDVTCGASPLDPVSLPHPGLSYLEAVRGDAPSGLRIGFSPDLGAAVVQSDVAAAVEEGVRSFEKLGHRVELVAGGPPPLGSDWLALAGWGLASRLHERLPGNEHRVQHLVVRLVEEAATMTPEKWQRVQARRAETVRWIAEVFEQVDVLVTPTTPFDPVPAKGPFPTETEGRPHGGDQAGVFTMPFNLSWNPAATVRVGISKAGLPIGMQIVGPQHRDDLVLCVARAFERERPWHPDWPSSW